MKTKLLKLFALLNIVTITVGSIQKQPKAQPSSTKEVRVPTQASRPLIMRLPTPVNSDNIVDDAQPFLDSLKKSKPYKLDSQRNPASYQLQLLIIKNQDKIISKTDRLLAGQKAFADVINAIIANIPDTVHTVETRYVHDTITRTIQPIQQKGSIIHLDIFKRKTAPYYRDTTYVHSDTNIFVTKEHHLKPRQ